ncbi:PadR family transcriptional regulator [Actinomadura logoneensis]|nr:PadR family transcriptional regulator [Actinomadura logoneensis]
MSRKLTPLALTVLRMLCDGPMHPYEMQQRIRLHAYDHAVKVTHGSLYHTVDRLASSGLIEPVETNREGRRPERTVYAVTPSGRDAACDRLADLLSAPSEEFPLFGAALAFVPLLSEQEVARHLRNRAVVLEALVAGQQASYDSLRKRGLGRHRLLDLQLSISRHRAELDFTQALVADLDAGRLVFDDDLDAPCAQRPPYDSVPGHGARAEENE